MEVKSIPRGDTRLGLLGCQIFKKMSSNQGLRLNASPDCNWAFQAKAID